MSTCYLNGEFIPLKDAKVSVMDRAFMFGDAVYEVIPVKHGKVFAAEEHIARLERSLSAIDLKNSHRLASSPHEIFLSLRRKYPPQREPRSVVLSSHPVEGDSTRVAS